MRLDDQRRLARRRRRPPVGRPRSTAGPVKPRPGDHVLLLSATSETCPFCRNALAPWLEEHPAGPPPTWEVVHTAEHDNPVLYRVR